MGRVVNNKILLFTLAWQRFGLSCTRSALAFIMGVSVLAVFSMSSMANEPIKPLVAIPYNTAKATLGKRLFSDVRLSNNDSMSCASCHRLDNYGADDSAFSQGIHGKPLKRNTPTIFNAGFNFTQMWDGRLATLEARSDKAVTSKALMGMPSWDAVVNKLSAIDSYEADFLHAYGQAISASTIQHALAEYQRSLVLLNSPFDRYLLGDQQAINSEAKKGYRLFKAYGCTSCHQGANVGGNMFQKMGVLKRINWDKWNTNDVGRYALTQKAWDKYVFKVPSLRLVVKTAPYFHDGSAKTLSDAIDKMAAYQLDRPIPEEDKQAIIAFLSTLPGELPKGVE